MNERATSVWVTLQSMYAALIVHGEDGAVYYECSPGTAFAYWSACEKARRRVWSDTVCEGEA